MMAMCAVVSRSPENRLASSINIARTACDAHTHHGMEDKALLKHRKANGTQEQAANPIARFES